MQHVNHLLLTDRDRIIAIVEEYIKESSVPDEKTNCFPCKLSGFWKNWSSSGMMRLGSTAGLMSDWELFIVGEAKYADSLQIVDEMNAS